MNNKDKKSNKEDTIAYILLLIFIIIIGYFLYNRYTKAGSKNIDCKIYNDTQIFDGVGSAPLWMSLVEIFAYLSIGPSKFQKRCRKLKGNKKYPWWQYLLAFSIPFTLLVVGYGVVGKEKTG